ASPNADGNDRRHNARADRNHDVVTIADGGQARRIADEIVDAEEEQPRVDQHPRAAGIFVEAFDAVGAFLTDDAADYGLAKFTRDPEIDASTNHFGDQGEHQTGPEAEHDPGGEAKWAAAERRDHERQRAHKDIRQRRPRPGAFDQRAEAISADSFDDHRQRNRDGDKRNGRDGYGPD